MFSRWVWPVACLFVAAPLVAKPLPFSIPAQPAAAAVQMFIKQSGVQVTFSFDELGKISARAVTGSYEPSQALELLLKDTGLTVAARAPDWFVVAAAKGKAEGPNAGAAVPTTVPAAAAPNNSSSEAVQLEAFQVAEIGQRYVNQDALQSKRAQTGIYDSLAQDDIGKLPDLNIADSFRRIPGISALNDEDEGRFVIARGMQPALNHITIEGVAVATHDAFGGGGRNVNIETIPASSVKRLEVFKSFLPNMDAGSIGSYLNLTTRSASDKKGTFLTAGFQTAYFSQRSVPARSHPLSTRGQLMFSQTFGADDRFGLSVSIEDFRKSRDQEKIIQDTYNYFNAAGTSTGSPLVGNGYAAPGQFRWYSYNNDLVRNGLNAKFEFNPSARFRSYLSMYRYRQTDDEDRFGHQLIGLAGISNQTATSGTYTRATAEVSSTHNDIRRKLDGVHYHAELTPADENRILFDVAFSGTSYQNSTPFIGFRPLAATTLLGIDYDSSTFVQHYRFTSPNGAAYFGDPANYVLNNYNYRELKTEEYVTHAKLSYGFNTKGARGPIGFEAGGDFKRLDRKVNNDRWNYANAGFVLSRAARSLAYTPPHRVEPFLFLDDNAWEAAFQNGSGPGFTLSQPSSFEQSREGDFKYLEDISAGYLMGTYTSGRFRAAGGLRYESVDAKADTFRRLVAPNPDTFIPVQLPVGYANLLPSATASYEISDRFWVRAGVSKSLGRPDPSDIASLQTISSDGLTVSRGNPDLKPRDARNYDLSFEYYFPKAGGIFSVALFRKEISDDIFNLSSQETVNGLLATVTQPTNASSSSIQGVEIALVRNQLPWLSVVLPGLGFSGNITFLDTEFNYLNARGVAFRRDTLPLQPKSMANAALFYAWGRGAEVRVAYDFKDSYLSSLNANSPWFNEGWKAYGQWDVTFRYRLTKHLHLDASVRNFGNAHRVHVRGENLQLLHEDVDSGSSYWLGLTYRL